MKAIVRTAAAGRSRLGNAQVASPTLAAQSAPLLARGSMRPVGSEPALGCVAKRKPALALGNALRGLARVRRFS